MINEMISECMRVMEIPSADFKRTLHSNDELGNDQFNATLYAFLPLWYHKPPGHYYRSPSPSCFNDLLRNTYPKCPPTLNPLINATAAVYINPYKYEYMCVSTGTMMLNPFLLSALML